MFLLQEKYQRPPLVVHRFHELIGDFSGNIWGVYRRGYHQVPDVYSTLDYVEILISVIDMVNIDIK